MEQDIRWLQRYDSFHRANKRIQDITESDKKADDLSELEMEGLIQRFEYTFELGWKVLQDLLKYKGYEFVQGPNGTLQKAFEDGLIADHDGWRRMAKARVTTSHTYNEGDAIEIVRNIYDEYSHLLQRLDDKLNEEKLRLEMNNCFDMYGLSDTVITDICGVFRRYPNIEKVLIFGSRAKGTYSEGSDIDLAAVGDGLTFNQLMDINIQIEDLGLLYKVDVVDYNKNIGTPIGEHINRVGKPFYNKTGI